MDFKKGPVKTHKQILPNILDLVTGHFFLKKPPESLPKFMEYLEKVVITRVLVQKKWNQKEAAKLLGFSYTTLNSKVKRYGIHSRNGDRKKT